MQHITNLLDYFWCVGTANLVSSEAIVLCQAHKTYGAIIADNGGNFFISGASHPAWNDAALNELKNIPTSSMEAVLTGATLCTDSACSALGR